METPELKARLVALLREGSAIQQAFVDGLSAEERDATGRETAAYQALVAGA